MDQVHDLVQPNDLFDYPRTISHPPSGGFNNQEGKRFRHQRVQSSPLPLMSHSTTQKPDSRLVVSRALSHQCRSSSPRSQPWSAASSSLRARRKVGSPLALYCENIDGSSSHTWSEHTEDSEEASLHRRCSSSTTDSDLMSLYSSSISLGSQPREDRRSYADKEASAHPEVVGLGILLPSMEAYMEEEPESASLWSPSRLWGFFESWSTWSRERACELNKSLEEVNARLVDAPGTPPTPGATVF